MNKWLSWFWWWIEGDRHQRHLYENGRTRVSFLYCVSYGYCSSPFVYLCVLKGNCGVFTAVGRLLDHFGSESEPWNSHKNRLRSSRFFSRQFSDHFSQKTTYISQKIDSFYFAFSSIFNSVARFFFFFLPVFFLFLFLSTKNLNFFLLFFVHDSRIRLW